MAYAGLATRGYSAAGHLDGSIALIVRDGFPTPPSLFASLATFGYGQVGSSISALVRQFYNLTSLVPYPPPPGKQYVDVAGLPWPAGAYSILEGAAPPVANGDIIICDLFTTPGGYPVTMHGDGTFQIATAFATSRETIIADVFDVSALSYYGVYTNWVNNHYPQSSGLTSVLGEVNVPLTLDLADYTSDFDNDPMTYAVLDVPLPSGLDLVGSVVSGTPDTVSSANVTFRITDITGDYFDLGIVAFTINSSSVVPPVGPWTPVDDSETSVWMSMSVNQKGPFQVGPFQINFQQGTVGSGWVVVDDSQTSGWSNV